MHNLYIKSIRLRIDNTRMDNLISLKSMQQLRYCPDSFHHFDFAAFLYAQSP